MTSPQGKDEDGEYYIFRFEGKEVMIFNKQLERRLKTIESFQHRSTAQAYLNLLIAYLRQKPYTDCRRRRKQLNGKTRLQAAQVTNLSKSWLQNCLKTPSSSNR